VLKKKFIYKNLLLYFFLFAIFKYIENKNYFNYDIFIKSFNNFEVNNNFPIKNKYAESATLLFDNKIDSFNLSDSIYEDVYLRYKIITLNYPKKFDQNSVFFISFKEDEKKKNCKNIDLEKKYLKLIKCNL
jgi:hypothetical protein